MSGSFVVTTEPEFNAGDRISTVTIPLDDGALQLDALEEFTMSAEAGGTLQGQLFPTITRVVGVANGEAGGTNTREKSLPQSREAGSTGTQEKGLPQSREAGGTSTQEDAWKP